LEKNIMNEQQNNEQIADQGAVEVLSRASIADVLAQRITVMSTSPKMLEIIDKRVEKFLVDVIDDSFSSWGDFSKGAKEAFKNALPGNIDSVIDLARYNSMIADRLSAVFASSNITNDMVQKAEKALKNAMEEDLLPPVIKLSVLLEAFIDDHAEQAREENWEFPDFRLIDSESVLSTEYSTSISIRAKKVIAAIAANAVNIAWITAWTCVRLKVSRSTATRYLGFTAPRLITSSCSASLIPPGCVPSGKDGVRALLRPVEDRYRLRPG
jgi:hypothetical protein